MDRDQTLASSTSNTPNLRSNIDASDVAENASDTEVDASTIERDGETDALFLGVVLYPVEYVLFIGLACMDIVTTWVILSKGGREVNHFADSILQFGGLAGMVFYKLGTAIVVVCVCEFVGRKGRDIGLKLVKWAVLITGYPVVIGWIQLLQRLTAPLGIEP